MQISQRVKVVYIAGNSYSGSTLLGLLLGSDPKAFFGGEINQLKRINQNRNPDDPSYRRCTCGESYENCCLWSHVKARFLGPIDFNPAPGFSLLNFKLLLKILNPCFKVTPRGTTEYGTLIETIVQFANERVKSASYVVDSSKSVLSLYSLANSSNVDLHVLEVIRDGVAVTSSCRKHGRSVGYGMVVWLLSNFFMVYVIRKMKLKTIRINYGQLCNNPDEEFERINRFLGLTLNTSEIVENVRREGYHILGGNKSVTDYAQKVKQFEGIQYNDNRGILTGVELCLTSMLLKPFNRWFLGRINEKGGRGSQSERVRT